MYRGVRLAMNPGWTFEIRREILLYALLAPLWFKTGLHEGRRAR